jgi:hypothetical protein
MGLRRNWTECEKKYWMAAWVLPVKFQSNSGILFLAVEYHLAVSPVTLSGITFWMVWNAENGRKHMTNSFYFWLVSTDDPSIDHHFYTLNHNFTAYGHSAVETCFQECHWDCGAVWCPVSWLLHSFLFGSLCNISASFDIYIIEISQDTQKHKPLYT